jgi:hypothetical protein
MHLPAVSVRPAAARRLMSGNPIACGDLDGIAPAGEPVRVYLSAALPPSDRRTGMAGSGFGPC